MLEESLKTLCEGVVPAGLQALSKVHILFVEGLRWPQCGFVGVSVASSGTTKVCTSSGRSLDFFACSKSARGILKRFENGFVRSLR